jgi:hypothetical protein
MKAVIALILVLGTLPCSSGPSESEAKKFLADQGNKRGQYRVVGFEKTNATSSKERYAMEYKASLECLVADSSPSAIRSHGAFGDFGLMHCYEVGKRIDVNGTIYFDLTENGWRINPSMSGLSETR